LTMPYRIFETDLGWVGLMATAEGLVRSVLPMGTRETVEKNLTVSRATFNRLSPPSEYAVRILAAYYRGEAMDLSGVMLDLTDCPPFDRAVYSVLIDVGRGTVITYGKLARRAGRPKAARAVGGAMSRNPLPPFIPCHRVVAGGGAMGGFTTEGGVALKRRLLEMEGARFRGDRVIIG
jgi:methylated-DNA-[protein]-cysteine S-methyltransferase